MRHLHVGKLTVRKSAASVGEHQIRRLLLTLQLSALAMVSATSAQTPTPAASTVCKPAKSECGLTHDVSNASTDFLVPSAEDAPTIQDNSFLVEEAYNQEFGVVQHIQTFQWLWNSKDWAYTFTQEWPVDPRPRHQLSYTLARLHSGEHPDSGAGFGDLVLNYRYQLLGGSKAKLAFSPRLSAIFPTGSTRQGRGVGSAGIQTMLPLSLVVTKKLVTHWNVGATIIPVAHNESGDKAATFGYNFGQSIVWLARPRLNLLLETVVSRFQTVPAPDTTEWNTVFILNPGIRWAYNFKNGLQIVPGFAVPIGVGPSSGENGVFLYLSFEHPYRKLPKE
jgi:hypothetical protein